MAKRTAQGKDLRQKDGTGGKLSARDGIENSGAVKLQCEKSNISKDSSIPMVSPRFLRVKMAAVTYPAEPNFRARRSTRSILE